MNRILLCSSALAFVCLPAAQSQVPNDDSFSKMLLDRVIRDIFPTSGPGAPGRGLQINTVPQSFSDDPRFETFEIYRLVDTISPQGAEFKKTPNQFTKQYGVFIRKLGIPPSDHALAPKLNAARAKYEDEVKTYEKVLADTEDNWQKFHEKQLHNGTRLEDLWSKNTWLSRNGGDPAVAQEQARATAAQDWLSLANQASAQYRQIADSIVAYDNAGNRRNVLVDEGDERQLILYYDHTPRLKAFIAQAKTMTGPAHAWDYNHTTGWKSTETSTVGGSVSYFGLSISGGGTRESFQSDEESFGFHIEFGNWGKIAITPGDWFDPAVITEFADGPFAPLSGIKDKEDAQKKLWSPQTGSMPWIVSELIVVYKPTITITMGKKHYDKVKSSFSGKAGISLGPFSFGASAGGSKEDIHWDDSHNTLIANGPETAQILGVIHSYLPKFN